MLEQSRAEDPGVDDRVHVVRLADSIVRDVGVQSPVSLDRVASYQGIANVVECALPTAGCLVTDPATGSSTIRLRAGDHPHRRRFSGFHEVVHTFMPGYQFEMQLRCDPALVPSDRQDLESLCDLGASELILPRQALREELGAADFGVSLLRELSQRWEASLQAVGHRIAELWPEPAMFVVAEVQNKPRDARGAEPALRLSYASRRISDWPYMRRFKSIDSDDPLARAREGEVVDERTTLQGISAKVVEGVHVSAAYFPFTDQSGERHERVLALYRQPQ